jgi:transcriptional regulator with XRE-family HTH domain
MRSIKKAAFPTILRQMLDEATGFSREEWAKILQVTPPAISQWLSDKTVPKALTLRSIVDVVKRYSADGILQKFDSVANQPAEAVSSHPNRMSPTIAHYMVEPVREGFLRILGTLRPPQQELVLIRASQHCHALRDEDLLGATSSKSTNDPSSQTRDQPSDRVGFVERRTRQYAVREKAA